MLLTIKPATLTNVWSVEVHGYSGDADANNRETVYEGPSKLIAMRTLLEARALAKAYPNGRAGGEEYSYSRLVETLFSKGAVEPEAPFAWAEGGWSHDVTGDDGGEATIRGCDIFWIDERGAKLFAQASLTPAEQALIDGAPSANESTPYPIESLVAAFEALALDEMIPDPKRSGAKAVL